MNSSDDYCTCQSFSNCPTVNRAWTLESFQSIKDTEHKQTMNINLASSTWTVNVKANVKPGIVSYW